MDLNKSQSPQTKDRYLMLQLRDKPSHCVDRNR